jgi:hypothetical protein
MTAVIRDQREAAALGIVPPHGRLDVAACIAQGVRRVCWPVRGIMIGGYALIIYFLYHPALPHGNSLPPAINLTASIIMFASPFVVAWLWWSVSIPKWRIWALQHVDDWLKLESAAITGMLIWRRGSIFGITEIKSREQRDLERALIAYRDEHG